ncbi:SGNH/GDSL hydrolase family protein [Pelagicoccus mobilis]|uniref:SGNH/GDSL hydrolase family protein n=1 Tax=Pelagicoccus mobilis TaxID=415221 RepID=A0A934RVG3_9BACT|nr:SGNH/GDSL hydrolase family protein [Pelagicoccus mobilis]MBK1876165.1 SGNH/GDSL hydrolase family protein [Pelagicoccus mobilis]
MPIPDNIKLLFIGDSITDCGRERRTPDSPWDIPTNLGNGYVDLLNGLIQNQHPESNVRILNRGIGGNTVRDLAQRWQRDVIHLQPDWLSIKIGINDVWRQFDSPRSPHVHVLPDEFESTYRELLELTRPKVKRLFLITPYYLHTDSLDPMRARMDEYRQHVITFASEYEATLVDSQIALDRLMKHLDPLEIAEDRVHPGTVGHMAIAQAFLSSL